MLRFRLGRRRFAPVLLLAVMFTVTGSSSAQVILRFPGDGPGIPAYARVERPFVYHTEQWAAIAFYRSPACVPADFNLLDLFHLPDVSDPGAFGCALTVAGFELWKDGPAFEVGPRHTLSVGSAVPVWFVSWPVLQGALADDVLTIVELESLVPLKGTATIFHEMLHPAVPPGMPGGAKVPHLTLTAKGTVADGRSFEYQFTEVAKNKPTAGVRIVFR